MSYSRTSITKTLSAVVITCAVAAFYTAPVAAQTASKLNCSGCVKSKQLKNGGVKNKDLKDNAINSQKIADGTVGNVDLGGDAVTGDKILDGTVTGADVLDNSLTGADVQDSSLTGADVQNNSLTGLDVTNLTGSDINSSSIPSTDISNEAGVDFRTDSTATITFVDTTVIFDTLTAPATGSVTVVANGYFDRNVTSTIVRCSVRAGTSTLVDFSNEIQARLSTTTDLIPFSLVRSFTQTGGTTQTYRVNCDISTVGNAFVREMNIALIYHPTRY